MGKAIFKSYENGLFTFIFDDGLQVEFEEIHPKALYKYNLKVDTETYLDKEFKLTFSEVLHKQTEAIIYRIESLSLVEVS